MWWHCEDANARSTSDWFELLISDNSCDAHYDELGDQFAFNFWALADDHQQKFTEQDVISHQSMLDFPLFGSIVMTVLGHCSLRDDMKITRLDHRWRVNFGHLGLSL